MLKFQTAKIQRIELLNIHHNYYSRMILICLFFLKIEINLSRNYKTASRFAEAV